MGVFKIFIAILSDHPLIFFAIMALLVILGQFKIAIIILTMIAIFTFVAWLLGFFD